MFNMAYIVSMIQEMASEHDWIYELTDIMDGSVLL